MMPKKHVYIGVCVYTHTYTHTNYKHALFSANKGPDIENKLMKVFFFLKRECRGPEPGNIS